jgi:nitroreductase
MEKQNYIFKKSITEIIKSRISVRTYEPIRLEENIKRNLNDYIQNMKGPFAGKVRFKIIDSDAALNSNIKLGTYGIIKGVSSFAASAVEEGDMNLEELGYELEGFVLYAASLGLGTCWMGGTFKKGEFAKALELKESELLPIVTPIGYPANSEGLVGTVMRRLAGSKNRKPWEELFFNLSFDNKLTKAEAGIYAEALEMVRLAPSASNKQPWRIVRDNDKLHFYLQHTKGYSSALGFDMQRIDIGIAMCHLDFTLKEAGVEGQWKKSKPEIKDMNELSEYVVTWVGK